MNKPNLFRSQRGAATLGVSMLLLLVAGLAATSASRVLFFNQKASVNEYQHAQAFAAAQAGVERGLAYLSRVPGAGVSGITRETLYDLRTRSLKASAFPLNETLPESRSRYSVRMSQPEPTADPYLIEIVSTGCSDGATTCPEAGKPRVEVRQLVKFRQLGRGLPEDALLVRGTVNVSGNLSVSNTTGQGAAVRAAGTITSKGSSSINGPSLANDAKLGEVSKDEFFNYFFGDNRDVVKASLPNLNATFPSSGVAGGAYWIDGDTAVHGGIYGTPTEPVVFIVNGNLKLNGNTSIYGLLYVVGNGVTWENTGGGTAQVVGATVSEGNFSGTGTPDFIKNGDVLSALNAPVRPAKVPGSWRDF